MGKALTVPLTLLFAMTAQPSSADASSSETAVFAGGCFWGVEAVFEHVRGVNEVTSGFAGGKLNMGSRSAPRRSGFAEAVRIEYDPSEITYEQLLEIFMTVAHDPTQLNRQGPDVGIRYRSAIFPQDPRQKQSATRFLQSVKQRRLFAKPITTRIESGGFELAPAEHQDYVRRNPRSRYVIVNDLPKLLHLKRSYPNAWKP